MSLTQFAMVEELAEIVKDNLRCKHLVLSMEDTFIHLLEDNNYSFDDGIIELEPMDPYCRLLLHRLADIFGFAHSSVGEADERHLVLERCPETSIPSILVRDILCQKDESEPLMMSPQLLRRNDDFTLLKANSPSYLTFKEREAAYLAARDRIFSVDVEEMKEPQTPKPRNVPMVARRMIAHALGQKINPQNLDASVLNSSGCKMQTTELNVQDEDKSDPNSTLGDFVGTTVQPLENVQTPGKPKNKKSQYSAASDSKRNMSDEQAGKNNVSTSHSGSNRNRVKECSKDEHMGAAKRMFANALGLQSATFGRAKCSTIKSIIME